MDARQLIRDWAETVVVTVTAIGTVSAVVWAVARRHVQTWIVRAVRRSPGADEWIVGALMRRPAHFKEVSGEVWSMDIERWEEAYAMAKETHERAVRIERDVTRLAERDGEFNDLRGDVLHLKRESEQQVRLLGEITKDVRATREAMARMEGRLEVPRRRHRSD